mmetsp:Transcript_2216/g.3840  ORF Transcript_2216/g.3840 Transcript_2216/m.3840 type:complete len:196 (+) Transcript_2216:42-629(+)
MSESNLGIFNFFKQVKNTYSHLNSTNTEEQTQRSIQYLLGNYEYEGKEDFDSRKYINFYSLNKLCNIFQLVLFIQLVVVISIFCKKIWLMFKAHHGKDIHDTQKDEEEDEEEAEIEIREYDADQGDRDNAPKLNSARFSSIVSKLCIDVEQPQNKKISGRRSEVSIHSARQHEIDLAMQQIREFNENNRLRMEGN